jgi:hypothetical protein
METLCSGQEGAADRGAFYLAISAFPSSVTVLRRVDCFPELSFLAEVPVDFSP